MPDSDDEDYFLPLQDQRVFGAGIKRKRINFVRASSTTDSSINTPPPSTSTTPPNDVSSRYLSIVLPDCDSAHTRQAAATPPVPANESSSEQESSASPTTATTTELCPVCAAPIPTSTLTSSSSRSTHESSLAHQVCLEHVHPPSHLPRSHVGVRYLSSYGWDPDARRGLGAREEGITAPIKATKKNDTAGLRERSGDLDDVEKRNRNPNPKGGATQAAAVVVAKSDAKQVRVRALEARKRAERLRATFYGPDLERYLGPEPSTTVQNLHASRP